MLVKLNNIIINTNCIKTIEPDRNGKYAVRMIDCVKPIYIVEDEFRKILSYAK